MLLDQSVQQGQPLCLLSQVDARGGWRVARLPDHGDLVRGVRSVDSEGGCGVVVAEPDICERDVARPLDSAGWAAEVAPNPIEVAALEFADVEFASAKARLPDTGVGASQQVAPIHLFGEAALRLDFFLDCHGVGFSLACIRTPDGLVARAPRASKRRERRETTRPNPSLPSDPRLSASESAKPHVRPNIPSGAGGHRLVPGTLVCGSPENPRSCAPGDIGCDAENTRRDGTNSGPPCGGPGSRQSVGIAGARSAASRGMHLLTVADVAAPVG